MRPLTWIASRPQSGSTPVLGLVAGYLLDAPPAEVSPEDLLAAAPDLVTLFSWGRTVPLDEARPSVVKTTFPPAAEVLDPYREATGRIVYVVRDPRDLIARLGARSGSASETWTSHVREWTVPERVARHFPNVDAVRAVRFEDANRDPVATLSEIVRFLGVADEVDGDRVRRAVENWTRETLRPTVLGEAPALPGIWAFRDLAPPRPAAPKGDPPSRRDVEAEYQRCVRDDEEFGTLARRFGY